MIPGTPIWRLLDADLHMQTLNHEIAPVGLLNMIHGKPRRILDIGCFCGASGRWLKSRYPGCIVVGVELLAAAAGKAAKFYDHVINKPLEAINFAEEGINAGSFDIIIAADVLEHMINPWGALERLRTLLAAGGGLYASIPNVRNLSVLQSLAEGKWAYEGSGILDITHLRFFTLTQVMELFSQTGWRVDEIGVNPDAHLESFIQGRDLATMTEITAGSLVLKNLSHQDILELFALQFFVRAYPSC